jgi:HlyD family secretion protein
MPPKMQSMVFRWLRVSTRAGLLVVVCAIGGPGRVAADGRDVPVSDVVKGDVRMTVYADGELKASHTAMLSAPPVGGGALRITRLTIGRDPVKKDDIVIEFDPSEQEYKVEQSRSELLQAQQEIEKAKADAEVLVAEDKVALLKARYAVKKAVLDVQKKEISSVLDGAKFDAALVQAKRELSELEGNSASKAESSKAAVYLAQEKYNKAKLEMDQAQQNIKLMHVTAPFDGLLSVQKNFNASGGFFFTGMQLPDYRAGDQTQPGNAIAQVVDPKGVELTATVEERERSNIKVGQTVQVVFEALPGRTFHGTAKTVGGLATKQIFDDAKGGTFNVTIELSDADPQIRPGMTAHLLFQSDTKKDVLSVPRQAVFLKDGKSIVYVKHGTDFDAMEVMLDGETESRAIVKMKDQSLNAGVHVALVDPTMPRKHDEGSTATGGAF